tara:strand:- start:880 stop:1689 length:810 start_codon:yes stop_codon:yes gene_type:complete
MFKSSAIQKTTPNPISLIPQKGFKWEIDEAKNILKIIEIDSDHLFDLDPKEHKLCIYGWDKEPKEFFYIQELDSIKFPIEINLKEKKFDERIGRAYFRLRIFEIDSKKIIRQSKSFTMSPESNQGSLLNLSISPIGSKIAELELDDDDGPVIKISSNFKIKNEIIDPVHLKKIAISNPIFCCSFWPSALKQIFESAIDNFENDWAQDWLRLSNDLFPGQLSLDRNDRLKAIDGVESFKTIITNIIDKWIEEYSFDQKLFDYIFEEGEIK